MSQPTSTSKTTTSHNSAIPSNTKTTSNPRALLWLVPALVALAVLVAGALVQPRPLPSAVVPVGAPVRAQVCLVPQGQSGTLQVSGSSGWQASTLSGTALGSGRDGALPVRESVVLTPAGQGLPTAGVELVRGAARSWASCSVPSVDGALVVADPATATITLGNADQGDAVVDLTLLGPAGQVRAAGSRGIVVPGHSQHQVPLGVLTDKGPVAVLVHTSSGRVAATAQASGRAVGLANQSMSQTATSHVFPVVEASSALTGQHLVLANPGDQQVSVSLLAIGVRGRFSPNPAEVVLAAHSTATVNLATALPRQRTGDAPRGITVTSPLPVAASVQLQASGDQSWVEPAMTGRQLAARVPAGTLQVANPGQQGATVSLDLDGQTQKLTLQPGVSAQVPVSAGPLHLTSDQPVAAVVNTRTGLSQVVLGVAPTASAEQPLALDPSLGRGQR